MVIFLFLFNILIIIIIVTLTIFFNKKNIKKNHNLIISFYGQIKWNSWSIFQNITFRFPQKKESPTGFQWHEGE